MKLEAEELRLEADRWRKFFQHPDILAQVQERAGTAVKPEVFNQGDVEAANEREDLAAEAAYRQEREKQPGGTEFVKAPNGSDDFAVITPEKATKTGLKPIPIRLEPGNEKWGMEHIRKHLAEIKQTGFGSLGEFIEFVANNFQYAKDIDGSINLVAMKPDKANLLVEAVS